MQKVSYTSNLHSFASLENELINFTNFFISSELGLEENLQFIEKIYVTEISYFFPGQKIISFDNFLFKNVEDRKTIKDFDVHIFVKTLDYEFKISELQRNLELEINNKFNDNINVYLREEKFDK